MDFSVVLSFFADCRKHLSHGVVDALDAAVSVRTIDAGGDCFAFEEVYTWHVTACSRRAVRCLRPG